MRTFDILLTLDGVAWAVKIELGFSIYLIGFLNKMTSSSTSQLNGFLIRRSVDSSTSQLNGFLIRRSVDSGT
jgi:hypothetical protein